MPLNLIRRNNQTNVTAYHDCVLFHSSKGKSFDNSYNGSVFKDVYNEFGYKIDTVLKKFILRSGMGMIYGRQFELPDNEEFEIDLSALTGIKYVTIYAEIDTRDVTSEKVAIKSTYASAGYVELGSANIYKNKQGVATMELYRIYYDASNPSYSVVITRFNFYVPGEAETVRSVPGTSLINGRKVSDIVESNRSYVKNAAHAEYSDSTNSLRGKAVKNDSLLLGSGAFIPQVVYIWGTDSDTRTFDENTTSSLTYKSISPSSSMIILKYHLDIKLKYNLYQWPWGWSNHMEIAYTSEFSGYTPIENVIINSDGRYKIYLEKSGNTYVLKIAVSDNCGVIIQRARVWIEVISA